jgi:LCP family protein required for cell wall assembly
LIPLSNDPKRPAAPARRARSSRPKLRNQLFLVFGIVALALGSFYAALVVATQIDQIFFPDSQIHIGGLGPISNLPGVDNGDTSSGDSGPGGRINILVMGLDRRPSDGGDPTRTDTMFVMSVDPSAHTARGLAMPRDLYVNIPSKTGNSTYKDRINTVYEVGELQKYPGGGPALAKQVVGKLLGIKINYYVLVDFQGFKKVVDLLGGIDVDVPAPGLNDPYYSETEKPGDYYPCVFKEGVHHMTSSDALCYARSRNYSPGGDLDRILRQQRIVYAVMKKATDLHVLADPGNVLNLWKRYRDTIVTDLNDIQIPGYAKMAASIDPDQLAFLSVGPATQPYTTSEGAQVLLPSDAGIKQIVDAFLSDNKLTQENAVVQVQNATADQNQGPKAVDFLSSLGVQSANIHTINQPDPTQTQTVVIDYTGKTYTADRIASWLGLTKDRVKNASITEPRPGNADIVVILGSDAKLESAVAPGITPPTSGSPAPVPTAR